LDQVHRSQEHGILKDKKDDLFTEITSYDFFNQKNESNGAVYQYEISANSFL
jgi:hypothetical protein